MKKSIFKLTVTVCIWGYDIETKSSYKKNNYHSIYISYFMYIVIGTNVENCDKGVI